MRPEPHAWNKKRQLPRHSRAPLLLLPSLSFKGMHSCAGMEGFFQQTWLLAGGKSANQLLGQMMNFHPPEPDGSQGKRWKKGDGKRQGSALWRKGQWFQGQLGAMSRTLKHYALGQYPSTRQLVSMPWSLFRELWFPHQTGLSSSIRGGDVISRK